MFSESLIRLKEKNLLREIKNRNSPQGTRIVIDGKEYINFSSNNYLGLANHPHVIESAQEKLLRGSVSAQAHQGFSAAEVFFIVNLKKGQQNSREQNQPLSLIQAILQTQG